MELASVVPLIDALHGRIDVLVRQGTDLVLLAILQDLVDVGLLLQLRDQMLLRLEHELMLVLGNILVNCVPTQACRLLASDLSSECITK